MREVGVQDPGCLCYDICKRLDILVFSDEDEKPLAPSLVSSRYWVVGDPEDPEDLQKVGDVVPAVVVCHRF